MYSLFKDIINSFPTGYEILNAVVLSMLALFIVKMIAVLFTKNAIVNSKMLNKDETANLYYLLPKALLKVTSTAKVRIIEDESINKVTTEVLSQEFKVEPEIIGDNDCPIALRYKTCALYNDVVSFTVGANGLLQTVNTKVKDETSTLVTSITDAPKKILTGVPQVRSTESIVAQSTKVSIREYKKIETIDPSDNKKEIEWNQVVGNEGSVNVKKIVLGFDFTKSNNKLQEPDPKTEEENKINSQLTDESQVKKMNQEAGNKGSINVATKPDAGDRKKKELKSANGIYSRPIVTNKFVVTPKAKDLNGNPSTFFIGMPSSDKTLMIPLKRGNFIEKTNDLILTNGLITSNSITKPSELVGFISIPIDIIKAIVSIPAQLLTFTINRTTQLKDLEKQKGLLATEVINNENTQLTRALKLQQEIKASQAAIAESEKSIVEAKKAILKAIGGK